MQSESWNIKIDLNKLEEDFREEKIKHAVWKLGMDKSRDQTTFLYSFTYFFGKK